MSNNEAQDFLMGGGVPSAFKKDDGIGVTKGGQLTEQPEVKQQTDFDTGELLFWDDGSPRKQLVVTVQTTERDPMEADDTGLRRFYVKGNLQRAVRDAVRASGAKGLEVGGTLQVTRSGREEPKKRGMDGAWIYTAQYTAAASNFLADNATPPAQAQAPAAQPAPATNGNEDSGMEPNLAAALANLSPEERAALLGANK